MDEELKAAGEATFDSAKMLQGLAKPVSGPTEPEMVAQPDHRTLTMARDTFTPDYRPGTPMEADVVPNLPVEQVNNVDHVLVAGQVLDLEPEVARRILSVTREAFRMNADHNNIYCDEFAVMLCGGTVQSHPVFSIETPEFEFEPGVIADATDESAIAALPAMQPIEMGILLPDGTLDPIHTVVKLPGASNLCVSKLGGKDQPVVITDFQSLAAYYEATHCSPIIKVEAHATGLGKVMEYRK